MGKGSLRTTAAPHVMPLLRKANSPGGVLPPAALALPLLLIIVMASRGSCWAGLAADCAGGAAAAAAACEAKSRQCASAGTAAEGCAATGCKHDSSDGSGVGGESCTAGCRSSACMTTVFVSAVALRFVVQ